MIVKPHAAQASGVPHARAQVTCDQQRHEQGAQRVDVILDRRRVAPAAQQHLPHVELPATENRKP